MLRNCCVAEVLPTCASILGHLPSVSHAYKMLSGASKNNTKLRNYSLRICSDFVASPVFSSICVDLMSARQSGLVHRSAARNKHFLPMGFGGDLVATLVDRRVARSSDAAKNLAWIGFLLRRVCVADERQGYLHQKRLPQFSIF